MTSIRDTFKKTFAALMNWLSNMDLARFSLISFILVTVNYFPLITELGFYLDDWPQVYSWTVHGHEGIKQYWMADSRWFTWWIQSTLFPLLGNKPIFWHLAMIFLRWVTSLLWWLILAKIWPDKKTQNFITALLFSIYPLFVQQSSAVMFSVIWVCFALFLLSLFLMVQYTVSKKHFVLLIGLGIIIDAVSLFSYEYFIGLELFRLFVLILLINREKMVRKKKVLSILKQYFPWFTISLFYIIWRGFLIKIPTLRSPVIFKNYLNRPHTNVDTTSSICHS